MSSIRIITDKPVAYDSPDHIQPFGTAQDNSINWAFNRQLRWWIPTPRLRVLDLGCSGGGFVRSILQQGGFAVGIEGSDYSKRRQRAEWATIPDHLFTADITEPFQLVRTDDHGQEQPLRFSVITAWEVIEHIHPEKLAAVFENISRHLAPRGVVIMSVSPNEDVHGGVVLHQTVADRDWWLAKFAELGFVHHDEVIRYFGEDWVRGGNNAPRSFHVVLTRADEQLPFRNRLRRLMPVNAQVKRVRGGLRAVTPEPVKGVYRRIRYAER